MTFLIGFIGFVLGFIFYYILTCIARAKSRYRIKHGLKKVSLDTYAKLVTTLVIVHGMILTSFSYVLAWRGLDPVVDVSSTIVREIVAPLVVYLCTNMVMNIFEKNKLSFSVPLDSKIVVHEDGRARVLDSSTEANG